MMKDKIKTKNSISKSYQSKKKKKNTTIKIIRINPRNYLKSDK